MKKSNKAIVTGGSSGIGLEIIKTLEEAGWKAVSWDINPAPDNISYIHCDVSSETSVKEAYKKTIEQIGGCDLLVNNCGLQYMAPIDDYPLEKWNLLMGVLLTGTFLCSREVIPGMRKNKWGRIVNISSIHGRVASPYKSAYVAAKHGVLGLSKVIAQEVAVDNITVNSICPGFVDTPLMRNQIKSQMELNNMTEQQVLTDVFLKKQDIKKLTTPKQIADMVLFLSSDAADTMTGEVLTVSGGWGL